MRGEMIEYGVFDDEGLVEGDLPDETEALVALGEHQHDAGVYATRLFVDQICPIHEEQPKRRCQGCEDDAVGHDGAYAAYEED